MTINKKIIPMVILFFIFIKPAFISQIETINLIFNIGLILSFVIISIVYFLIRGKISKIIAIILTMQVVMFILTYINKGNYVSFVHSFILIIGFSVLTELLITENFIFYCKCLLIPLSIVSVINIITVIMFPDGLYVDEYFFRKNWFLGYYNRQIVVLLPSIYISLLYSHFINNRFGLIPLTLLLISSITILIIWPATSVVCMFMMIFFIFMVYNKKGYKIFNIYNYIAISVVIFFAIIIFRLQEKIAFVIEDLLNRSLTFTGRTNIWDRVMEYIAKRPLLGYGVDNDIKNFERIGIGSAHNFYLEIVYRGGFISLILFIILISTIANKLMKYKSNQISNIISYTIFVYFIMFQAESHLSNPGFFYSLLVIAYHVDTIIDQHEKYKLSVKEEAPSLSRKRLLRVRLRN